MIKSRLRNQNFITKLNPKLTQIISIIQASQNQEQTEKEIKFKFKFMKAQGSQK